MTRLRHRSLKKRKPALRKPLSIDWSKRLLEGGIKEKMAAIREAGKSSSTEAVPALMEALVQIYRRDDGILEDAVVKAIANASHTRDHLELACKMIETGDPIERQVGAVVVGHWGEIKGLGLLIAGLADKESGMVTQSAIAIESIAKKGHDCQAAKEPLFAALRGSIDFTSRECVEDALVALGVSRDELKKEVTLDDFTIPENTAVQCITDFMGRLRDKIRKELERATNQPADETKVNELGQYMLRKNIRDPAEAVRRFLSDKPKN